MKQAQKLKVSSCLAPLWIVVHAITLRTFATDFVEATVDSVCYILYLVRIVDMRAVAGEKATHWVATISFGSGFNNLPMYCVQFRYAYSVSIPERPGIPEDLGSQPTIATTSCGSMW